MTVAWLRMTNRRDLTPASPSSPSLWDGRSIGSSETLIPMLNLQFTHLAGHRPDMVASVRLKDYATS